MSLAGVVVTPFHQDPRTPGIDYRVQIYLLPSTVTMSSLLVFNRYSQSCWYFRHSFVNYCSSKLLSGSPLVHCNENFIYVFLFLQLRGFSPNFHIHVSVSDLYVYFQDLSTYFLQQNRQIQSWGHINRSQTHECGNRDCGRAIPFLGIFVSNFCIGSLQCTV
jgi:hypothetical protein